MSNLTLGSLFDGSGGFPLAGMMAGIMPIWASENRTVSYSGYYKAYTADETLRGYFKNERRKD